MRLRLLRATATLFAVTFFSTIQFSQAQSGLDTSFGDNGEVTTNFGNGFAQGRKVIELDNNKLLVIGDFETSGDFESEIAVAQYNADGSLDTSFGNNGTNTLQINSLDTSSDDAVLDAFGRILIVAFTADSFGDELVYLLRLTSNGDLDTTFGTNGLAEITYGNTDASFAATLITQPNGSIIVAGSSFTDEAGNDVGDFALSRFTASGVIDTTFGNAGSVITDFGADRLDAVFSLNLQPDGKIVAVGSSFIEDDMSTATENVIAARYNSNGTLDSTFGISGLTTVEFPTQSTFVDDATLQADGKIVIVGDIFDANSDDFLVMRLNTDGNLDTSFDTDGIVTTNFTGSASGFQEAISVNVTSDGKLIVLGDVRNDDTSSDFTGIARYLNNGALDTTFRGDGKFLFESNNNSIFIGDAIISSDSNLLATGEKGANTDSGFITEMYLAKFLLINTLDVAAITGNNIVVYPNPASDVLNFDLGQTGVNTEISIFNILGKQVASVITESSLERFNLGNLSNGMYLVKVSQNGSDKTFKIMKI